MEPGGGDPGIVGDGVFRTSDVSLPAFSPFPIVLLSWLCYNHLKQKV